MEPLFTWIHLSDFHFGHGDSSHSWDQQLVLKALREDIAALQTQKLPAPDALLVTGDIAFSGGVRKKTELTGCEFCHWS